MKNNEMAQTIGTIGKMTLASVVSMILAAVIIGLLVSKEVLQPELGRVIISLFHVLVVFAVSCIAAKEAAHGKMIVAVATVFLIIMIQLLIKSIAFTKIQTSFDWRMISAAVVSLPAGIVGSRKKVKRR